MDYQFGFLGFFQLSFVPDMFHATAQSGFNRTGRKSF